MSPRMRFVASHHQDRSNTKFSRKSPELDYSQFSDYSTAPENEASKGDGSMQQRKEAVPMDGAAASVHPARDDEVGYDSSSSFEFHTRERSQHPSRARYLSSSRPIMPSKWNDAEKWILNKKTVQLIRISKKTNKQNCAAPEPAIKPSMKRADFARLGKFEFGSFRAEPIVGQGEGGGNAVIEVADAGIPAIRSATMRDMGTEMTPVPSQEPSRSPTPVGATTPLRSPASTPPSSPLRQVPSLLLQTDDEAGDLGKDGEKELELSDQELKSKITREIVSLGVHLGKMNIVAWARKGERESNTAAADECRMIEYRNRAAAWEEAEKSKHEARFKREEIRIQALESQQNTKLEARIRRIEVRVEQMKTRAQAKLVKKMASARAAAEAIKARQHKKTAAQAEYIRQTGRIPSAYFNCWWWSRRSYS